MAGPRKALRWLNQRAKPPVHDFIFDSRDEVGQDSDYLTSRESVSDTFVEAYANSEVEVRVQIMAGHGPADAHRYVAVYRSMGDEEAMRQVGRHVSVPCSGGDINGLDRDEQVTMLVDIVKLTKFTQPTAYIPSLVRLYALDDPAGLCADTGDNKGDLAPSALPVPPALPPFAWWTIEDGESRTAARLLLVAHDELIHKMIKSAAQVVYAVPEDQLGIWIENGWIMPPVQVLSCIVPYLTLEGIGVEIRDRADNFFQLVSVGFGSTDLVSDPIEGRLLAAFHGLVLEDEEIRIRKGNSGQPDNDSKMSDPLDRVDP
jgi:hypothetical protein